MATVLSVSQLNMYVKSLLDGDFNLNEVYICGEISNFSNHYRTGHFYFTLKDSSAAVRAVMFRTNAQRLRFMPENGMRVIVRGSVSLFERDGTYQLYADSMQPDGVGALSVAFEQLKKRLEARGFFDVAHKKPLPPYPERIAVITSPTGAALQDIMNVLSRRFPCAQVVQVPVLVQGDEAPGQIAAAIGRVNDLCCADVIIVGRGGGSIEDLWAFNSELVAQAIYDSRIPLISAVGHETDYTIADFVADLRAPTPSAAAELAVPDMRSVLSELDSLLEKASYCVKSLSSDQRDSLIRLVLRMNSVSPKGKLSGYGEKLQTLRKRLSVVQTAMTLPHKRQLAVACAKLEALSPLKVLARGYAIVLDEKGVPVRRAKDVRVEDNVTLRLGEGSLQCRVMKVNET